MLKLGHHGSHTSTSLSWLSQLQPTYGLISCGMNNRFGHPHPDVIQRLQQKRIHLYRTDTQGMVQYHYLPGLKLSWWQTMF